jgi:site-specific DNA-cytosine methylase
MENIEALSWKLQRGDTGVGGRWDLSRPRVHRSGERVSGRMDRNKQLGNAVDPVVIEQIGRAIIEVENESST